MGTVAELERLRPIRYAIILYFTSYRQRTDF